MTDTVIRGHAGIGGKVTGIALVGRDSFSARYDLDRDRGVFARPGHALEGESYVGRILVLDKAKGGVATAWMFGEMSRTGKAPKALLLNVANPIMAQGAAFSEIALMHDFETDITEAVRTGDEVTVDPAAGTVTVRRK
ncbi:MAG: DUF126 domain-containing protein [Acetobacterales bacterium]